MLRSLFELRPFFVAGVVLSGHFEIWNVVLHDKCRTSGVFSTVWQAWRFRRVAETLAGVAQNKRCKRWFWMLGVLFLDRASFGELGQRSERVENLVL